MLPDLLVPETPLITRIPLADVEPVSFGVYYRTLQENPALKSFIQCVKELFS